MKNYCEKVKKMEYTCTKKTFRITKRIIIIFNSMSNVVRIRLKLLAVCLRVMQVNNDSHISNVLSTTLNGILLKPMI